MLPQCRSQRRPRFQVLVMLWVFAASQVESQPQPTIAANFPILLETGAGFQATEGPTLADLDQDGRPDIIVGSANKVYAFRFDGTQLDGWPQTTTYAASNSPTVGDLDGDGRLEVVTFDRLALPRRSFLYAWNSSGQLLPGFPVALGLGNFALTLYDLDNDGDLEIIGSFDYKAYVFHHDGSIAPGWPRNIEPFAILSKASVGDLNADGQPEIVFTAQLDVLPYDPSLQGRVYVWQANGELQEGWPVSTPNRYQYVGGSNPALADVDLDGFLEIAVGVYSFIRPNQFSFAALYRHDGTMMPGWPQYTAGEDSLDSISAGPAVADLDNDGRPDLIFGDIWDTVVAWREDGTLLPGWPVSYGKVDSNLIFRSLLIANPAVGDIDGDGYLEIFSNVNQADVVDGIWRGRIYAFNHDATSLPWSPLRPQQFASFNTVAMGDLNGNGELELVTISGDYFDGETWLTVWQVPGVPYVEERFPWPMYGRDRWHTSQYGFKLPDEPTVHVAERRDSSILPAAFVLHQNFPNPLSNQTGIDSRTQAGTYIRYELPEAADVRLHIFDILGKEVGLLLQARKPAGRHEVHWEGTDQLGRRLPHGLYFYRLEAAPASNSTRTIVRTQKLVLLN